MYREISICKIRLRQNTKIVTSQSYTPIKRRRPILKQSAPTYKHTCLLQGKIIKRMTQNKNILAIDVENDLQVISAKT